MADKEVLVIASKVKAYIKSKKMMTSSDAIVALSDYVELIVTGDLIDGPTFEGIDEIRVIDKSN